MASNPLLPGSSKSSSSGGGGNPLLSKGGGSSRSTGTKSSNISKIGKNLRNAIASGNTKKAVRLGRRLKLPKRDIRALRSMTRLQGAGGGFFDRLQKDISQTVTGTAKGLPRLGIMAGKELAAPVRLGLDVAKGNDVSFDQVLGAAPALGTIAAIGKSAVTGEEMEDNPLASGIGVSFHRTGERIANPRKAIRQYSRRPFSTLVEDAGNVAIVAGAAAKGARLAGLNKTATAAQRIARAGDTISASPFLPISRPARGLNRLAKRATESGRLRPLASALRATPEHQATRRVIREGREAQGVVGNQIVEGFRRQEKILPKADEQLAMRLIGEGHMPALLAARRSLPAKEFIRFARQRFGDDFSGRSVRLAVQAAEGKNPKLLARINEALDIGKTGRAAREEGYLARGNRAEQTGMEPLSDVVSAKTATIRSNLDRALKAQQRLHERADAARGRGVPALKQRDLNQVAARADRVVDRLQKRLLNKELNTRYSVEAAPARLRPMLETNRAAFSRLTAEENVLRSQNLTGAANDLARATQEIPVTLKQLQAAGIDIEHFIYPRENLKPAGGAGSGTTLPRTGRMDEARRRTGKGRHDLTLRAQAKAEVRRANQVVQSETAARLSELPFIKRGKDHMIADGSTLRYKTRQELNAEGLETWNPATLFETVEKVGPDTMIAPKAVVDAYRNYFKPDGMFEKAMQKTLDPATRAFKTIVLPLSPAWNVGNAVTNAFMATFLGGVDPLTLSRQIGKAIAARKKTGKWPGPERLYESGSTHETLDFMRSRPIDEGRLGKAAKAPVRAGYKINETVDNMFRSAVFLAKKKKYGDEGALKIALRSMGDFTNMSRFERNTIRRAVPFYAWLKHMSQAATRLPVEHPYRTAWILSMSNAFKDQEAWETMLPGYMQGFVNVGGDNTLSVQNFMPFSNPLAIKELGRNLNPFLKLAATNLPGSPLQGKNFLTNRGYTRPPGTGRYDEWGKPLDTAPSILEQLRGISPQVRMLDQLLGRKDVARYESGDPVMIRGEGGKLKTLKTPQPRIRGVSRYAGLPVGSQRQMEQIVNSIIARQLERWKEANPRKDTSKSSSSGNPLLSK